jgi:Domain of unknown function (DUF4286)
MILYNVTVGIDNSIEEDWKKWMIEVHIPDVIATGQFIDHKFFKVLSHDEPNSSSFSIQYFAKSKENLQVYQENFADKLQQDHQEKFANKFVAFRTVLESV